MTDLFQLLQQLSVRPRHPQADEEAQEAFKKTSPRQLGHKSPTALKAKDDVLRSALVAEAGGAYDRHIP
jgi:hypothetical protein